MIHETECYKSSNDTRNRVIKVVMIHETECYK